MVIIETTLKDNTVLRMEVESPGGLESVGSEEKVLKKVEGVVEQAVQTALSLAAEFTTKVREVAKASRPATASLQMGIKLGAEGNVIVAKASAEANLVLTLNWNLEKL